ncbi:hypothetical protein R6G80_08395, partial [Actinotignum urinale]|nr:hypothetical protein [Actinotignum urinale]
MGGAPDTPLSRRRGTFLIIPRFPKGPEHPGKRETVRVSRYRVRRARPMVIIACSTANRGSREAP